MPNNNGGGRIEKKKSNAWENQWLRYGNTISLLTLNTTLSNQVRGKKGIQCIKDSENWISSNLVSIFFFIPCRKKIRWMRAVCKRVLMDNNNKNIFWLSSSITKLLKNTTRSVLFISHKIVYFQFFYRKYFTIYYYLSSI